MLNGRPGTTQCNQFLHSKQFLKFLGQKEESMFFSVGAVLKSADLNSSQSQVNLSISALNFCNFTYIRGQQDFITAGSIDASKIWRPPA